MAQPICTSEVVTRTHDQSACTGPFALWADVVIVLWVSEEKRIWLKNDFLHCGKYIVTQFVVCTSRILAHEYA